MHNLNLVKDLGLLYYPPSKKNVHFAIFECGGCGSHVKFRATKDLKSRSKLCPSCKGKKAGTRHGNYYKRLYHIYSSMIKRCNNDPYYSHVNVCDQWLASFENFENWAMSSGYEDGLSIERIDNKLGYYPENCTFLPVNRQPENRGLFRNNSTGYFGVSYNKRSGKYKAYANVDKKQIYIGLFETAEMAAIARDQFVKDQSLRLGLNF